MCKLQITRNIKNTHEPTTRLKNENISQIMFLGIFGKMHPLYFHRQHLIYKGSLNS